MKTVNLRVLLLAVLCLGSSFAERDSESLGAQVALSDDSVAAKFAPISELEATSELHTHGRQLLQIQTTSQKSYLDRIKDALVGFVIGIVLFIFAFPFLIWNEFKSASIYRLLERARGPCRANIPSDKINYENEGSFIHTSGHTRTDESAEDPVLGFRRDNTICLRRFVEMYQWKETVTERREDKLGGSQEIIKDYSYTKDWISTPLESSLYQDQTRANPPYWPVRTLEYAPHYTWLGAFVLSQEQVLKQCNWYGGRVSLRLEDLEDLRPGWKDRLRVEDDYFYQGDGSLGNPQIGDIRISYQCVSNGPITVLGVQQERTLQPFVSDDLESQTLLDQAEGENFIFLIQSGIHTKEQMFRVLEERNAIRSWLYRLLGFLCLFIGLLLILNPVVTVLTVIPFLAHLVGVGVFVVALVVSLVLFVAIVTVAWLFARPFLTLLLVSLTVGIVYAADAMAQ